jgi:putative phosphoribosyl transferase
VSARTGPPYADRTAAGEVLADALMTCGPWTGPFVLALPRGGLPVAAVVADRLQARLDVAVVRKISAPGRPELAIGAVAAVGARRSQFDNHALRRRIGVTDAMFDAARREQEVELERQVTRFGSPSAPPAEAEVVLVDDGLATGATMQAAARAVAALRPSSTVVAVPVGAKSAVRALSRIVDRVVCPRQPVPFVAVGYAYVDFTQVEEATALRLLQRESS